MNLLAYNEFILFKPGLGALLVVVAAAAAYAAGAGFGAGLGAALGGAVVVDAEIFCSNGLLFSLIEALVGTCSVLT